MNFTTLDNSWNEGTYAGLNSAYSGLNHEKFQLNEIKLFISPNHDDADKHKTYRTVFEKSEIDYICFQVKFKSKFLNKPGKWDAKIIARCSKKTSNTWVDICTIDMSRNILPTEDTILLRNGWGNAEKGNFWKEGEYFWDVWIDDKLLVKQNFYVNDIGPLYEKGKPYFNKYLLQFYDNRPNSDKTFFKVFNKAETTDIGFNALLYCKQDKPFHAEFFIEVTKNNQHFESFRTQVFHLYAIDSNGDDYFSLWFHHNRQKLPGKWETGIYEYSIIFMTATLYSAQLEISNDAAVEGEFSSENKPSQKNPEPTPEKDIPKDHTAEKSTDDYLKEFNGLVGMDEIKKSIQNHINYLKFLNLRKQKGFDESGSIMLHSVFTGNPGTGKTTVVRMLGNIYKSMGLLSKGHVTEVDRSDLVGEFIGHTAPKVKKAIEEARGGILFIDEAYSLARKGISSNDFGMEVIEILLKEMTSNNSDLAIMCAGYPKEMQEFLEANPGLKSRFSHFYEFEDYTPTELLAICEYAAEKNDVVFNDITKSILLDKLIKAYRDRDKNFGNARFSNAIINEAKINLAQRLMTNLDITSLTDEQLSTIEPQDIEKIFESKEKKKVKLGIDENLLHEGLGELNALVGMSNIKQEVNESVKLIRFYIETKRDFTGKFSLHSIFTGNPGTGKTTVARIISKIYKALGLLERGHLVEVDREGLVAGYLGQTAIKTSDKIDDAMGGILFIDEAYSLSQRNTSDSFGNEAIQVILKRMEDQRGHFGIIAAGYTDNMKEFIESNPGLKSRFDRTFHFNDYDPKEMFEIALALLHKENLYLNYEAGMHLQLHLELIYDQRDEHFGNARKVRQIMEEIIRRQNLRMASLPAQNRNKETMQTITLDDVRDFRTY